jgi:hypothetical protein
MNKFVKTISADTVGYEFLKSLNGLLELTDRELEVLSIFLAIHLNGFKTKAKYKSIDCTENRKAIMQSTGITRDNMSRYVKSFRDKGIFIYNGERLELNKAITPVIIGGKTVQTTLILKIVENEI